MLVLVFYVPDTHLDVVKQAVFAAGAGRIGHYEGCCWQVKGQGQYRPMADANPFIGAAGEFSVVDEYRVEMVLEDSLKAPVLAALLAAHPYEEVAYHFIEAMV